MSSLSVIIPDTFYRREARNQYENIARAIVRECLQNSQDAGASRIEFEVSDGRLSVGDNGSGLNLEQFQARLLTLGASEKETGSVGGFGAAKKLLLFAHDEWSVTGQRFKATGTFYKDIKTVDGHRSRGLQIEMVSDLIVAEEIKSALVDILAGSRVKPSITFNGEKMGQGRALRSNQVANEFPFGTLYVVKSGLTDDFDENGGRLTVRTNGIVTAFDVCGTPYQWYLEIDGCQTPSTEVLTESRDHLKYDVRRQVMGYIASVQSSGKTEKPPTSTVDLFGARLDEEGVVHHPEAGELLVNSHGDTEEQEPVEDTQSYADVREWDMDGERAQDYSAFRLGIAEDGQEFGPFTGQDIPEEFLAQARSVGGSIGNQIAELTRLMAENSAPEPEVKDPWRAPFAIMADGVNPRCFDDTGALKPKAARAMEIVYQTLNLVSIALEMEHKPIPALIYGQEADGRCLNGNVRPVIGININKVDAAPFELLDIVLHELAHVEEGSHDFWFIQAKEQLAAKLAPVAMSVLSQIVVIQNQKRQPARYWEE